MPIEVVHLFEKHLHINRVDEDLKIRFLLSMNKYLEHGRNSGIIGGRTYDYLDKHLTELMLLLDALSLSYEEKIIVLSNMPTLLNTSSDMITKYLLLGVLENEDNTFRKNKLINKTNDFRIGLKKLYGRYMLAVHARYPNINWNLLVHSTDVEFALRFCKNAYNKPYQIFNNVEEVLEYVDNVSLETLDVDEIISWDVNRELVDRYGERKRKI